MSKVTTHTGNTKVLKNLEKMFVCTDTFEEREGSWQNQPVFIFRRSSVSVSVSDRGDYLARCRRHRRG